MTTTTKEIIDKIMKDMYEAEYDDYIRIGVKEILETHLQELPQQEVENELEAYKRGYIDGQKPFIDILARGEQLKIEPNPIIIQELPQQEVEIKEENNNNGFYGNWICPECNNKNTKKICERCGYKIFNA